MARFLLILILVANPTLAEVIQMNKHIRWEPRIPGGIPDVVVKANVMDYGA